MSEQLLTAIEDSVDISDSSYVVIFMCVTEDTGSQHHRPRQCRDLLNIAYLFNIFDYHKKPTPPAQPVQRA
jgi:hypothetical protein